MTAPGDLYAVTGGRGALLSDDGKYRYRLWRLWDADRPVMVWVMLNPSTADAEQDDPTIRKCVGFARLHGYGGILVVNLFAARATDPKELPGITDPVGPENDDHIIAACEAPILAKVVGGWGVNRFAERRARSVVALIRGTSQRRIKCFRRTKNGHPSHPLYLPYSSEMVDL